MMSTKSVGRVGGFVLAVMVGGLALVMTPMAMAQQAGTVTGHVTCGDTQRPARFAGVVLLGVPKEASPSTPKPHGEAATFGAAMNGVSLAQTETGLDGSYSAVNVAPGDYYVFASVPGYVQPTALVQAAIDAGADPAKQLPELQVVHVGPDGASSVDITVQRGGAISGHVMWDDGSPAARAIVVAVSTKGGEKNLPPQLAIVGVAGGLGSGGVASISDDLGHYRISGLAPGEYVVKAMMQLQSGMSMMAGVFNMNGLKATEPLVAYAPMTFHKAQAKALTLHAGDELKGEDLTINLTGTHSVSGRVVSAEDGHGLSSGTVELTDASDKDVVRGAPVDSNGNFTVEFVPQGTYNLEVKDAADTPPEMMTRGALRMSASDTGRRYEGGAQSVVVGDTDVVGLEIALQPVKGQKAGAN